MNTTKGKWINDGYADGCHYIYADKGDHVVSVAYAETSIHGRPFSKEEAEANATLIALAGNLNQKYDLSKLEECIARLQEEWATAKNDIELSEVISRFLRSITRETQTT